MDESAFYLLPGVVTTWAPTGATPVLRGKLSRDHLSVISAISPEGQLYLTMQQPESIASVRAPGMGARRVGEK